LKFPYQTEDQLDERDHYPRWLQERNDILLKISDFYPEEKVLGECGGKELLTVTSILKSN
jgi:hypothetical protein